MHTLTEKIGIVNEVLSYMQNTDNATALAAKTEAIPEGYKTLSAGNGVFGLESQFFTPERKGFRSEGE